MLDFLIQIYPWWGLPFALVLLELSVFFKRGRKKRAAVVSAMCAAFLVMLAIMFFVVRYIDGFDTSNTIRILEKKLGGK